MRSPTLSLRLIAACASTSLAFALTACGEGAVVTDPSAASNAALAAGDAKGGNAAAADKGKKPDKTEKADKGEKSEKGEKADKGKAGDASQVLPLPLGFSPEGIAFGRGSTYYVGSLVNGAIFSGDAQRGTGSVIVAGQTGRSAVGLEADNRNRLFVAGGNTGQAYVYDATTGATLATYQLAPAGTGIVNDVAVTKDAAFFTQSSTRVLYRVPLAPNGALPAAGGVQALTLSGDFVLVPGAINANGIVATPNGDALIIVNSATGTLYRVDPETGVTDAIDLGGGSVPGGDGLLLDGRDLYVVQGASNQISVVRLSPDLTTGTVTGTITDPNFRYPSTVAEFGNSLFVVNARFNVPRTPTTAFEVVRIAKKRER